MAERGWPVILHQEVSSPREPISDGKEQQRIPGMPKHQRGHHDRNSERRTDGMQDAVQRVAVLFQVELEELVIRCELLWFGHGGSHLDGTRTNPRARRKVYYDGHNSRSYVTIFYS